MPYRKRKMGSKYEVYNADTGRVYSYHTTRTHADAQLRLLRKLEHGSKSKKRVRGKLSRRRKTR